MWTIVDLIIISFCKKNTQSKKAIVCIILPACALVDTDNI